MAHGLDKKRYTNVRISQFSLLIFSQATMARLLRFVAAAGAVAPGPPLLVLPPCWYTGLAWHVDSVRTYTSLRAPRCPNLRSILQKTTAQTPAPPRIPGRRVTGEPNRIVSTLLAARLAASSPRWPLPRDSVQRPSWLPYHTNVRLNVGVGGGAVAGGHS